MLEGHPGVDHSETLGEAREEAAAEMESVPVLSLNMNEWQRASRRMDAEDFANFVATRGLDFKNPANLVLDGKDVGRQFASAQ